MTPGQRRDAARRDAERCAAGGSPKGVIAARRDASIFPAEQREAGDSERIILYNVGQI